MKLFKKKDKNIEAEETLAKNAESVKTAADGKNAGAAQQGYCRSQCFSAHSDKFLQHHVPPIQFGDNIVRE